MTLEQHSLSIACLLALSCAAAYGQGKPADYARADSLRERTQNKLFRARVEPHWLAGNTRFWYRNDLPGKRREFILVDAPAGRRAPAFDHARVAAALTQSTGKAVRADRLPVERLDFHETEPSVTLYGEEKAWSCDLQSYALRELKELPAQDSSLPAGDSPYPTSRTGAETTITFVNRGGRDGEIYWMDPDGRRRLYATVRPGGRHEQHTFAGHVWVVEDTDGRLLGVFEATAKPGTALIEGERPASRRRAGEPGALWAEGRAGEVASPDGRWSVFVQEHNLWLRDRASGEVTALTRDGSADDAYTEEFAWSPDSHKLAALKRKAGEERKVYLIESSPEDQLQPKLQDYSYRKPGDRIPTEKPHLFDVTSRRAIPIDDALAPTPWEISELRWDPDSRRFTFLYNQRGHQVLRIVAVDAATGETTAIVDEQSKTFIDYAGKRYSRYLDDTHEILWMSERDGWNHLYLYDASTGTVKNQVTRGPWVVRGVDRVDTEKRQIWFRAGGIYPGQDPYYVHYCRINFDGSGLVILTQGDGTHTVTYSPDNRFLIDTHSRVDQPPVTELRRVEDGKLLCTLEKTDATALSATGWRAPERFVAKGRDGKTDIYGVIFRPTNFDPQRRYPVIEQIYAGPQGAFVPKAFAPFHRPQELAELGFILVQIDGMGTSYRSKAFHDVCWKNLGDAGFPDRIRWLQAAAKKYPSLDLSRVGIYGGSAGGQNALDGLLTHPDFYKAGAADCGCHDNRMDKIWWNELWMGWPLGPHYGDQSNVTNAHKLKGKLLLTFGELDKNVDPSSTMQVVNALIKADKEFELIVVPGAGHGAGETPYCRRRRQDFFVRHLLGVTPPERNGAR
jgi:dipeptidyl aminopeptidase/acylaminoacyl peptidase